MSDSSPYVVTPELAAPFRRFAATVEEFLEDGVGLLAEVPEEDPDLQIIWEDTLREGVRADCDCILELVQRPEFGHLNVPLTMGQVDALLRACSAIRLKVHRVHLAEIEDEKLERAEVALESLPEQQARAYMIYVFLANLQEVLVDQIV